MARLITSNSNDNIQLKPAGTGLVQSTTDLLATNHVNNFTTTSRTNSATYTLTASSNGIQAFTDGGGTITGDSVVMPVVSTLPQTGWSMTIQNNGSQSALTINSSGANLIMLLQPGFTVTITALFLTGTTASSWSYSISNMPKGQYLFFTPTLTFQTVGNLTVAYTTQRGRYCISGGICYFLLSVAGTLTWTTSSGQLRITGLPATPNSVGNGDFTGMNLTNISGLALTAGASLNPVVSEGTPIIFLNLTTATSSSSALLSTTSVPTGTVLNVGVSGWFFVG